MKRNTLPAYIGLFLLSFCLSMLSISELHAQSCGAIANGEMNGRENKPASAWTILSGTAKIKSAHRITALGQSPQGGFIMEIFSNQNQDADIKTQISGLIPGNTYTLNWFVGAEFNPSVADKNSVGYYVKTGNQEKWFQVEANTWKQGTLVFIANNQQADFKLILPKSSELLLDGLSISCGGNLDTCPSLAQGNMVGEINKEPHGWAADIQTARLLSSTNIPRLGASPQGGVALLLKEHQHRSTRIETKLYGVHPGTTYTLSWYAAAEPRSRGGNNSDAAYTLDIDGQRSNFQAVASRWKQESMSFTADSRNPTLVLNLKSSRHSSENLLLDGFQLTCSRACSLVIPSYSKN